MSRFGMRQVFSWPETFKSRTFKGLAIAHGGRVVAGFSAGWDVPRVRDRPFAPFLSRHKKEAKKGGRRPRRAKRFSGSGNSFCASCGGHPWPSSAALGHPCPSRHFPRRVGRPQPKRSGIRALSFYSEVNCMNLFEHFFLPDAVL
jgi:hypothetical protein